MPLGSPGPHRIDRRFAAGAFLLGIALVGSSLLLRGVSFPVSSPGSSAGVPPGGLPEIVENPTFRQRLDGSLVGTLRPAQGNESIVHWIRKGTSARRVARVLVGKDGAFRLPGTGDWRPGNDIFTVVRGGKVIGLVSGWRMIQDGVPEWKLPAPVRLEIPFRGQDDSRVELSVRVQVLDESGVEVPWREGALKETVGPDGRLLLEGVPAGGILSVILLPGRYAQPGALRRVTVGTLPERRTRRVALELATTVIGRIGPEGAAARGDIEVRLRRVTEWKDSFTARVEPDGTFRIAGVEPGRWIGSVSSLPDGRKGWVSRPLPLPAASPQRIIDLGRIDMVSGAPVQVEARNLPSGGPVPGLRVRTKNFDTGEIWPEEKLTGPNGNVAWVLPPGKWTFEGFPVGGRFVTAAPWQSAGKPLAVREGSSYRVSLVNDNGQMERAMVRTRPRP